MNRRYWLSQMLINKLPPFDENWSSEAKLKWFAAYHFVLDKVVGALERLNFPIEEE